jgi:hypothetical protein
MTVANARATAAGFKLDKTALTARSSPRHIALIKARLSCASLRVGRLKMGSSLCGATNYYIT